MKKKMMGLCVVGCALGASVALAGSHASVQELFVISAEHAEISKDKTGSYHIVLQHPDIGYFTDRPVREAGRVSLSAFVTEWTQGSDSFAQDNPNAALSAEAATEQPTQYMELSQPLFDAKKQTLTFTLHGLEGGAAIVVGEYTRPMMFIDNFQMCNGSYHHDGCL